MVPGVQARIARAMRTLNGDEPDVLALLTARTLKEFSDWQKREEATMPLTVGFAWLTLRAASMAQYDCEAARCLVQQDINDNCPSCVENDKAGHGQFVSCVTHVLKRRRDSGDIPVNLPGPYSARRLGCADRAPVAFARLARSPRQHSASCDIHSISPCPSDSSTGTNIRRVAPLCDSHQAVGRAISG